jgi:hypothetical protein
MNQLFNINNNNLYQVTLSYACYGIETHNGLVIDVAPIARWMIGKKIDNIYNWIASKGGKLHLVKEYIL